MITQITVVTSCVALSEAQKSRVTITISSLNALIVSITKQIMVIQQELSLLIGAPYSASFLSMDIINLVKCNIIARTHCKCLIIEFWRNRNSRSILITSKCNFGSDKQRRGGSLYNISGIHQASHKQPQSDICCDHRSAGWILVRRQWRLCDKCQYRHL